MRGRRRERGGDRESVCVRERKRERIMPFLPWFPTDVVLMVCEERGVRVRGR